jgi:MoaA/NifB/PqqE/SkfB family radical SAM enzyme
MSKISSSGVAARARRAPPSGWQSLGRFVGNALQVRLHGSRALRPLLATYHVTSYCNLNCVYCEDFGLRRNRHMRDALLPLQSACKVLDVLRTGTENLVLSGGEALLHPDIEAITAHAARLRFRQIVLITNGLLLPRREGVLPHLSRLVISLDSLDRAAWDRVLDRGPGMAERIIATIERYAGLQEHHGYRLAVNCVVMPDTVKMARQVIEFCMQLGVAFSLSPQGIDDQPHAALRDSAEYQDLIRDVIRLKDAGAPAVGSRLYLEHMLRFDEFQCYPTLNVRVLQNGDLVYPCRPIADRGNGRGGVGANLLDHERFEDAFRAAVERFGEPPLGCRSCFQQCFAEPSLLVQHPLRAAGELLRYHTRS